LKNKYFVSIVSVLLVGLLFVSLAASAETLFEKVKKKGVVVVGIANEKPFGYIDESGNVTGESPEIARAVLNELGIEKMKPVVTKFGSLIPGMKAGRFDMITAGAYITSDREKEVDFAHPQYKIGSGMAVKAGNPYDLHSYEDVAANPKVKIGIMAGAYEKKYAKAVGVKEKQIVSLPTNVAGIAALVAGRIDCLVATSISIRDKVEMAASPEIEVVEDFTDPVIGGTKVAGYSSVAFPSDADDFREAYNEKLEELRASGKVCEILTSFDLFSEANCVKEKLTVPEVLEARKALEEAIG
jgi:polar amino acid transport system substrate-binding protein